MPKRPLPVTLIAALLILAGAVGFVYHFHELNGHDPLRNDAVWIELVRVLAVVAGVFLLRGQNWARWLAMVWIGFHVVISLGHSWTQLAMHGVIFTVFAFFLFLPKANAYFRHEAAAH